MGGKYEKSLPEPKKINVVDFFCGCGGMSWGFKNTRQSHLAFNILAGIDIDTNALKTYAKNVGAPALELDVFSLADNPALLSENIAELAQDSDSPLLFIGCAPCQGFSAHRKKDSRDDERNDLMHAFARICEAYSPDYIIMENVPEIITGRFSHYFEKTKTSLKASGYSLTYDILDLSLFGVPQRRRRAVVTGSKTSPIPLPEPVFDAENAPTVRNAISHLAPIDAGETDPLDPMHQAPKHIARIVEKIRKISPDGGDRRSLPAEQQLDCHSKVDDGSSPGFTDVYGRLRWDTPSVTITAKSSTPSCGRFLHPEQHRNISVREAAILQGFPQTYVFEGPFVQRYRQIGEAVPPLFSRFLAKRLLDYVIHPQPYLWPIVKPTREKNLELRNKTPVVVDAFCGAGGIALGFKWANFDTAYAFDVNEEAVKSFVANISAVAEVNDVQSEVVRERIRAAVQDNEWVLAGGPPCQGFSQQRRGEDSDERNNLVLAYADLIKDLSDNPPSAVILENVTYLDSPRGRRILEKFISEVEEYGYAVHRYDFNSADFAVPQLRRRIILACVRNEISTAVPEFSHLTSKVWPTVGDTLGGLQQTGESQTTPNHTPSKEGDLNRRRISYVDMGDGRLSIPDELQLACHRKYDGHLDVYGRLDWFGQARTITGGFDSFTRGEFAHPFLHRSITHREAARIQGFPDYFAFKGNKAEVRKQIGNAVPPPLAFAIATGLKAWMGAAKSESRKRSTNA